MAEYIEREAALNWMYELIEARQAWTSDARGEIQGLNAAVCAIEDIPAADVRPVRRGHWITEEEAEEKGDYSLRDACSVCGHCDWDCTESASFNYCPNCGADMRGGEQDGRL